MTRISTPRSSRCVAKLWRKVWLQAGRVEDIPEVGNYITFNVLHDTILIVRAAAD